jgi:protein tyrosine/serine phosphatase
MDARARWRLVGWSSIALGLCLAVQSADVGSTQPLPPDQRPATWASRLDTPGLPNLHQVAPGFYRGAQPSAKGMARLEQMGVRTVVNLRAWHSDSSKLKNTGLDYERFHVKPWHSEDEDVIRFLQIVTNTNRLPVFVHCQHGADRTGLMCAMYRVTVQGWSREEAIQEMTRGGFGFHSEWKNLIRYVETVDVDEIKRRAGIGEKQDAKP